MPNRRIVCGAFALLTAASALHAQATTLLPARRFGITAGVNSSTISDDVGASISRKMGMMVGISAILPVATAFSIQPELLYTMKGGKSEDQFGSGTIKMDYVQIPVLARFDFATASKTRPFIYGGPAVAFRAGCKLDARDASSGMALSLDCDEFSTSADLKSVDFGLVIGAGLAFDMASYAFTVGARYDHSLTAFTSDGNPKHRVISIVASLEFPWSK